MMTKDSLSVHDEIEYQGQTRKITKIDSVSVLLDGVDDLICIPVEADSVHVSVAAEGEIFSPGGRKRACRRAFRDVAGELQNHKRPLFRQGNMT